MNNIGYAGTLLDSWTLINLMEEDSDTKRLFRRWATHS